MTAQQKRAIWLFDSQCVLCDGGVQYTLAHEKSDSIRFVSIQGAEGRALALHHGIDPEDPESFLFIDEGQALEKSDAVIALLRHLRGPARLLLVLRFLPKTLRDWLYLCVARHRYRIFGKREQCRLPDPKDRDRFSL